MLSNFIVGWMTMNNVYLAHHGIKGQKWGVRRFQNANGSLTEAGKKRYSTSDKVSIESTSKSYSYKQDAYGFSTEKEYEDWVKAGMPKRKDKTITVQQNRHTYSSKGSGKQAKEIDKMAEDENYHQAINKYDQIGFNAVEEYQKNGKEAVQKLLSKELKGARFKFTISEEKELVENGENYLGFYMTVYGKNFSYTTQGDRDYSDDQRFEHYKSNG